MDTSYLAQQVTTIIGKLHTVFDEIGVPSHDRDSRESELFSSLSETLHNHLRTVANEKNELVEEAQRLITTIQQMEASLDDSSPSTHRPSQQNLKVTYPLLECLSVLKEKHRTVSKLHQERYEQVKKLVQALESYSSHLEPSFIQIKLPPVKPDGTVPPSFDLSPSYINSVDKEFTRVYDEYNKRVGAVQQAGEEIIKLWAELGTPQAQTEENIIKHWRESPEQLGLHQNDLKALYRRRDKLREEKQGREKRMKELRSQVEGLWDRLGIEDSERKAFLAGNRGCGLKAINDLEDELSRLNELKRQNLHLFVEDARSRIQALWDELFFSEEEAVEFTPLFCDVYSDALLSAHESEISRLEALKDQRAPTLQLISRHRSLIKDRDDLASASQDASRLLGKGSKGEKRDPTRLLREEKMRKRIAKELPKVEQELSQTLGRWEEEYGRPYLVFGERYLDTIEATSTKKPPPRSKTPTAMAPPARSAKSATKPTAQAKEPSRDTPAGPLRSKTPVGTATLGRKLPQPSPGKASAANKSPSRIPARIPLGSRQDGANSPERQNVPDSSKAHTVHGRAMMAPPPKMRDMFAPQMASTPSNTQQAEMPPSGSVVRHITPEDPYSDYSTQTQHHQHQPNPQFSQSSRPPAIQSNSYTQMPPPSRPAYNNQQPAYAPEHHRPHPAASSTASTYSSNSRQISATSNTSGSTAATTMSGSENWESYDDDPYRGEPEPDATDAYYAKLRAASGKRTAEDAYNQTHESMHSHHGHQGKKLKAFQGAVPVGSGMATAEGRILSGSDAGWTDEDAF